ncbi:hypothetical protein D3C77_402630 [compost metagenome]
MGRSCRDLLGQHRCDELPLRINVENPFDADEDVIHRTQPDRPAPDDTAAFRLDHPPHGGHIEVDRGQGLHGVGGSGRRGDGARRGLWHDQAAGGEDGHHDRRGPVARQAADAVLVHDDVRRPAQAVADVHHGAGERHELGVVERKHRGGGQKGREMDGRVASSRHILDDPLDRALVQPRSIDPATNAGHGLDGRSVAHRDGIARCHLQKSPSLFRERRLVEAEDVPVHLVQGGVDFPASGREQHLGAGRQALRAADGAVAPHQNYRFVLGVKAEAARLQGGNSGVGSVGHGHSSWRSII